MKLQTIVPAAILSLVIGLVAGYLVRGGESAPEAPPRPPAPATVADTPAADEADATDEVPADAAPAAADEPETRDPAPEGESESEGEGEEKPAVEAEQPAPPASDTPTTNSLHPRTHDYGRLLEGEYRTTQLQIRRPRDAAIELGRVYSPCPCLYVKVRKRSFAAGEAADVTVDIHSLTLEGKKSFPVYVEVRKPVNEVLRADVTCDVTRVPAGVLVRPDKVHLGAARPGRSVEVNVYNLTTKPLTVTDIACSLEGIDVTMPSGTRILPGRSHQLRATVGAAGLERGPVKGTITLSTDCDAHATVRVPVDGMGFGRR